MNTALKLKLGFLFFIIVLAVVTVVPSFYANTPSWWKKYMAPEGLRLGLDLQGGMHLVLEVDTGKAVESTTERISQEIREQLKKERIRHVSVDRIEGSRISVAVKNEESIDKLKALLDDEFRDLRELSRT